MGVSVTEREGVLHSYTISVDRSNGDKLGLSMESNTLLITAVKHGLISAWNEAHPHSLVRPTDQIVEVNGKDLDTHGADSLQEELNKQQVLGIKLAHTMILSVRLDTRYGKLGLRFDPKTLKIVSVDDAGLVAAWNLENIGYSVLIGDRIRAVNGLNTSAGNFDSIEQVHEELRKRGSMSLSFTRRANAQEAARLQLIHSEFNDRKLTGACQSPPKASTFIVHVNRTNGEKLGLNFENDSLTVETVDSEGVIADWNQTHTPGMRVQPSDQLMEVNGKHVSTHGSEGLLEAIQREPILQLTMARAVWYPVRIDKSKGGRLGCCMDEDTLEIKAISGAGLIAAWNINHPDLAVQPGDRFIEVNGKKDVECGIAVLNAEIHEQLVLDAKLVRVASTAGADANVATTLPVEPSPTIFSIKLEKQTGSLLGVTFLESNMQVSSLENDGLIHSWNTVNPDRSLNVGDQIVGVNGRHLATHGASSLLEAITGDKLLELTVNRGKFTVRFTKTPGAKIGVTFCQATLRVKTIEDIGLVAHWNRQHPDVAIRQGDCVIQVNGKSVQESGAAELIREMKRESVLRVCLSREPIAAAPDNSCMQLDTFTVQVDKSNGGKLGLQFDAGTARVDTINRDGLIADWNASHPESKVRLGDQLLEVNGRHVLTHGVDQLHEVIRREQQMMKLVFAQAHFFDVCIQRGLGQKLGLKFHPGTLEIDSIDGDGLAGEWNLANSQLAISPGDRILEVNNLGIDEHGALCLGNIICDWTVEELRIRLARAQFKHYSQTPLQGGINSSGRALSTIMDEDEEDNHSVLSLPNL